MVVNENDVGKQLCVSNACLCSLDGGVEKVNMVFSGNIQIRNTNIVPKYVPSKEKFVVLFAPRSHDPQFLIQRDLIGTRHK